ncbi:MAG: prepilin-type N-terminal cleavage/methylation domain-containing protein [Candidatus Levybacteria bacterium]|nr:prepilin-type N-terminal cleavage/methylation domain-containing protein [Candidatus Levybacteria bacterium]
MRNEKGFTLIELIIVIAVTAVLSVIGIAAFVSYSRTQALNAATQDVVTMLQVAKSRAQSQVIPENHLCGTSRFAGYQVVIPLPITQGVYRLEAVFEGSCTKEIGNQNKKLPQNISFDANSSTSIKFSVLTGEASVLGNIKINGYSKTKRITVSSSGLIRISD